MPVGMFCLVILSITEGRVLKSPTAVVDLCTNVQGFDFTYFTSLRRCVMNVETLLPLHTHIPDCYISLMTYLQQEIALLWRKSFVSTSTLTLT